MWGCLVSGTRHHVLMEHRELCITYARAIINATHASTRGIRDPAPGSNQLNIDLQTSEPAMPSNGNNSIHAYCQGPAFSQVEQFGVLT